MFWLKNRNLFLNTQSYLKDMIKKLKSQISDNIFYWH